LRHGGACYFEKLLPYTAQKYGNNCHIKDGCAAVTEEKKHYCAAFSSESLSFPSERDP
jgi:hypothetical protein